MKIAILVRDYEDSKKTFKPCNFSGFNLNPLISAVKYRDVSEYRSKIASPKNSNT